MSVGWGFSRLMLAAAGAAAVWTAASSCLPAAEPAGPESADTPSVDTPKETAPAAPDEKTPTGNEKAAAPAEKQPEPDPSAARFASVFAPPDRTTLRLLVNARQLIDQDRYAEAVRCLGAILESPQDYFCYPDRGESGPRSLKGEAQRLLGEMSERGRRLYELQYGARARQMLDEAAASGDAEGLAEVSRRFFHTQAGYEATLLLGLHYLDHGRPLAGASALERLRRATSAADQFEPTLSLAIATCWIQVGSPERANEALAAFRERHPTATVQIAGREASLFSENEDVLGWLTGLVAPEAAAGLDEPSQWPMFRGDAARNLSTAGGGPLLRKRWRVPTSAHPYVEALIEQIREADRQSDRTALGALHPLVVNNLVLMRTARNLVAVDFATGKRLWETPVDNPFETLLSSPQELLPRRAPQLEYALRLRIWADATHGTLSSDGQCVFAVEDLGLEIAPMQFHAGLVGGPRSEIPEGPRPYNRLAAYDVRTGKLKWHVGGSAEEFGLPQADSFFLGPPLPLMGRLYVIAERMGEIRLMVLDKDTGDLVWSQQLAGTDQLLLRNALRRMAGVSPSYADGVLVCPTSNRSIVAVELNTRSLAWGYVYAEPKGRSERQLVFLGARSIADPDPSARWIDSSVVLADGCVLVTPVDSDYLHCLNLLDGKLLWKEPRGDDSCLACVHQGKAVLVGPRGVRAVDLHKTREATGGERPKPAPLDELLQVPDDEETEAHYRRPVPAWDGRTVEFPQGATPSGTGFLGGDLYYVPLSTGEVAAVDLNSATVARSFRSHDGNELGNLVSCEGRIFSQDATGLDAFDQLDALRKKVDERVAAAPDDADALCSRGEILWDEGKLGEAVDCLRRSLSARPDPYTRRLLREALLDGLRLQFATYRGNVQEIERLIDGPQDRATFLRQMAVGLAGAGEHRAALEHYLKLIELDSQHPGMEQVDPSLSVRRDRWIDVQLAALRESAAEGVRTEMDEMAAARLKEARAASSPEAVQRFLDYFGSQPIATEARSHLARQLRQSGALLEVELLLERQERSADPQARGAAVAELAEMLRGSGRVPDAAVCYERLDGELADVVCAEGKTGREAAQSLPADDPVRKRLGLGSSWPVGRVKVAKSKPESTPVPTYRQATLPFEGDRGAFFADVDVELQQSAIPRLVGRDGLGEERWQLPLTELARQGDFFLDRGTMRVTACGHLLLFTSGQQVMAVDTLGTADDKSPRPLWSTTLDDGGPDPSGDDRLRTQLADLAGGLLQSHLVAYAEDPISSPRIVSEQVLCFQHLRDCIAVDPRTGKTLWVRRNLPPDCEVFGDHQYVVLVRPGEATATLLRTLDGSVLGEREIPAERERTFGRRVLVWREGDDGRRVLEMIDPCEDRSVWEPQTYAAEAALHPVDEDAIAVCEPNGRFVLVDLNDGRAIIDAKLDVEASWSELLVLPSDDQYVVIPHERSLAVEGVRRTSQLQGVASARIAQGRAYAFDREGKAMWPSPVKIENQWMPLSQPDKLPVLTFACLVQERRANGRTRANPKTSIHCLDKRTGRVIWREQFDRATNCFQLVGQPEQKTVELRLQDSTVAMTFTDEPPPPESDAERTVGWEGFPPQSGGPGQAILKAIRSALESAPLGP